ncbi:MAG: SGNH/GDSL hydrolase family protein [Rhizobacter sp.]|nr:SGNH/GDSL hydrolase family protein [Rhizobacter sp.]
MLVAAKLALTPLLLWQGHGVRKRALRLPEAQGGRVGVAGTGPVCLRVLIVGDSSAAGVGAATQSQALAGRLSDALAQRLRGAVAWQLVAQTGHTTRDAVDALKRLPLHPADVMVTALGVNDVVAQVSSRRWLADLDKLNWLAHQRAGVRCSVHSSVPPMQSFPLLPQPLRWVLGEDARRFNRALATWVAGRTDRLMLPLPFADQLARPGNLMAEDGFHPGPAIYALWAEQLAGKISGEIVPRLPRTTPTRRKKP